MANAYQASEDQLIGFTRICYQEQGSDAGAAAEMSLMLNKFEIAGKTGDASAVYSYVRDCGWWANSASVMSGSIGNTKNPSEAQKNNIKKVLEGGRTLPLYIDEHDYFGDIAYLENGQGSITSTSSYVQHKTIIHNNMGSTYTFYCFPTQNSDPFGYTSQANREKFGDSIPADGSAPSTATVSSNGVGATSGTSTNSSGGSLAGLTFTTERSWKPETARVEEGGHSELKTFYRINMSGAQFIKQVLAPYCRSKETGQGGYRLWFSDESEPDGTVGSKIYFKPDQYSNIEDKASENMLEDIDRTYQFSFGSGPVSSVLDFTPNYTGLVAAFLGGSEVKGETIDAMTNDLISASYDRFSDANRPSTGDSVFEELQYTFKIGDSSYTLDDLVTRTATMWYNTRAYGYTADMTVLGDPWIEPQSVCTVATYTPQGLPHYSSGVYLIYKVVDSISGGSFTSALNLVRNAIDIGVNDAGGVNITIAGETKYIGDAVGLMTESSSDGSNTSNTNTNTNTLQTGAASGTSGTDLNAPLGNGQTIEIPAGLGTYLTVTGYGPGGWHYANGGTAAIAAGTNQKTVWEKWKAAGSQYTDHIATINGRYLLACTSTFGKVGDYISFTLANGQVISGIMADEKSQEYVAWDHNPANKWGHDNGKCIVELEVDIDYYNSVGNPGNSGWKPEWGNTTTVSATNYGSAI